MDSNTIPENLRDIIENFEIHNRELLEFKLLDSNYSNLCFHRTNSAFLNSILELGLLPNKNCGGIYASIIPDCFNIENFDLVFICDFNNEDLIYFDSTFVISKKLKLVAYMIYKCDFIYQKEIISSHVEKSLGIKIH